jgi:hypothetical protein
VVIYPAPTFHMTTQEAIEIGVKVHRFRRASGPLGAWTNRGAAGYGHQRESQEKRRFSSQAITGPVTFVTASSTASS